MIYLCKTIAESSKWGIFYQGYKTTTKRQHMKERIKKVMEDLHMTQQVFADYINISPASLSSIFTGRTRPTLATVEAIKGRMPNISTDWLMFGRGAMYLDEKSSGEGVDAKDQQDQVRPAADVSAPSSPSTGGNGAQSLPFAFVGETQPVQPTNMQVKYIDRQPRRITEIRIFYDDQTWETFVPKK